MSPMLDIQRRHAEVFRIRLGEKGSKGEPKKLTDAIRVTSPSQAVVQAFVDVFGGTVKPWNGGEGAQFEAYLPVTALPVMVLPGQSITQWWEWWKGSVCDRRCDGFTETLTGQPCMCAQADHGDPTVRMLLAQKNPPRACKPMTRLNVICPDVAVVGAGGLVSHGMIAATTLPQAVAVAEGALSRGLMVPAVLRVVEHKGKRHYLVPQIEIVGVSLNELATGEVTGRLPIGAPRELQGAQRQLPAASAEKAPARKSSSRSTAARQRPPEPPLPGDPPPPDGQVVEDRVAAAVAEIAERCRHLTKDQLSAYLDEKERSGLPRAADVAAWTWAQCQFALGVLNEIDPPQPPDRPAGDAPPADAADGDGDPGSSYPPDEEPFEAHSEDANMAAHRAKRDPWSPKEWHRVAGGAGLTQADHEVLILAATCGRTRHLSECNDVERQVAWRYLEEVRAGGEAWMDRYRDHVAQSDRQTGGAA